MTLDTGFEAGVVLVETAALKRHGAEVLLDVVRAELERMNGVIRQVASVRPNADLIAEQVALLADHFNVHCVMTVGGSGLDPEDVASDAMVQVIHRPTPGIAELLRARVSQYNPEFVLTRGAAGTRGRTLIINLPDNPEDLGHCFEVLRPVLPAALRRLSAGSLLRDRQVRLL